MTLRSSWEATALDMRSALRTLRASPALTVSVVLTLALGIGAVATMYGLMSRLLRQPPPHVTEPERVARLFFHYQEPGGPRLTHASWYHCVHDRLRDEARTLRHVAAYRSFEVSVGAGTDAARAHATVVSAGFWAALGTRAASGRLFADDEAGRLAGARVAVLGHPFWQQRYGGNPDVIGSTLRIRGEPFEIIGVTPRGFRGLELNDVDLWLPLSAYTLSGRRWQTDTELSHVVRFNPGVTASQVDADLSRAASDIVDEDAGCERGAAAATAARLSVTARPLAGGLGGNVHLSPEARLSVWLVGIAIALVGVASANVASLLLLRALRRRREIAVRLALGMTRSRLAAQLFMESAILALLGGIAAVAVAVWGSAWMNRMLLPNLTWEPADSVDASGLALTAACVIGTAFLAGLAPVLQAPADPFRALQEGAARMTARRGGFHRTLLAAQTALLVVLLTGAGLFLRSLHNIRGLDLGLDPDDVLVATVDFTGSGREERDVAAFYERALERVQPFPGVERASLATFIPLRSARAGSIRPAGQAEHLTGTGGDATYVNSVTPGFFATAGTQIVEGRDFLAHERDGAPVVIVNEATARAGWPGRSPVGACVEVDGGGPCATVVGVVENARRFFLKEPPALLFYRPLSRGNADDGGRALFVRVAPGGQGMSAAALTRAVQALEPGLPFVRVQRLGDAFDRQIRPFQFGATVFTLFSVFAAVLAALGLYGSVSYAVMQRTREIGVRVALGARAQDVVRLVVREGLGVVLAGLLAGTMITLFAGPWITNLLFEVSPRDPIVFAAVGASLFATALLAALAPSFRATRVDPVVALRTD
jgi:predicted permease